MGFFSSSIRPNENASCSSNNQIFAGVLADTNILDSLDSKELRYLSQTCKAVREVVDKPSVWKKQFSKELMCPAELLPHKVIKNIAPRYYGVSTAYKNYVRGLHIYIHECGRLPEQRRKVSGKEDQAAYVALESYIHEWQVGALEAKIDDITKQRYAVIRGHLDEQKNRRLNIASCSAEGMAMGVISAVCFRISAASIRKKVYDGLVLKYGSILGNTIFLTLNINVAWVFAANGLSVGVVAVSLLYEAGVITYQHYEAYKRCQQESDQFILNFEELLRDLPPLEANPINE